MCGRFTLTSVPDPYAEIFKLPEIPKMPARYNIAPTQEVAAVRACIEDSTREIVMLRWGLVPYWQKDPPSGTPMINARAETVTTKRSFSDGFARRRCLILADGYYEWQQTGLGKQPWYIHMGDRRVFGMAGLFELWHGEDGTIIKSCAVLTTGANSLSRSIHDRMPVIIAAEDYDLWLDPTVIRASEIKPLLKAYPSSEMQAERIGGFVNSVSNDGPECLEPFDSLPLFQDPPVDS